LCVQGANQFTERFAHEVFRPTLHQLSMARSLITENRRVLPWMRSPAAVTGTPE
jgi:hypothetical protein